MKKYFFLAIAGLLLAASQLSAQISVEAGYENSRYRQTYSNEVEWSDPLQGFNVGAYYNINLMSNDIHAFSIQPGLKYSYVMTTEQEGEGAYSLDLSLNQHYLNLPVRFQYAARVMPGLRVMAFAGPNFCLGLSNTLDMDMEMAGFQMDGTVDLYTGKVSGNIQELVGEVDVMDENLRRFDVSAQVGLGVEILDRYEIRGGYDFGLMNMMDLGDVRMTRNTFFVGLGIRF